MQRDILYPDLSYEQWTNVLRGSTEVKTTENYRSAGAVIDQHSGKVLRRKPESLSKQEAASSGEYPHLYRSDDFWDAEIGLKEVPDSVVSAPQRVNAHGEMFNPYEDMHNTEDLSAYARYPFSPKAFDERLSASRYREEILQKIDTYPVVVVEGETGCGKTTQIPQYILQNAYVKRQFCNIIVTQPRRIAAISVSRQVNMCNNWALNPPGICSYQIGLESDRRSKDTRLLYCTTGVALRKLMAALRLKDSPIGHFTHIVLDEVHERDREMDLLMLLVLKFRRHFPAVKVVIMSATIQTKKIANYFAISAPNKSLLPAYVIPITGRQYSVTEFYLDDLLNDSRFLPGVRRPRLDIDDPQLNPDVIEICVRIIENFWKMEEGMGGKIGAVLVFLPGMQEIRTVFRALEKVRNLEVILLHSEINVEEQRRAFLPVGIGKRKVILSTNIAESSITVPDVNYVIDFCLNKLLYTDSQSSHLECLRTCWASKANCRQRAGRAGRVSDGRCYRLIDRKMYEKLQDWPMPELLRASLCQTILQVKLLDMGPPRSVLANAIDPPEEQSIYKAILMCKEVWALTTPQVQVDEHASPEELTRVAEALAFDGELTFMGDVLANLPVDVRLGKLILIGHMFGIVEDCIIIAASLTVKSFFVKPYGGDFDYYKSRYVYAGGNKSDPISYLYAYRTMDSMHPSDVRQGNVGIHRGRFEEVRLLVEDLKRRLTRFGLDFRDWTENLAPDKRDLRQAHKTDLVKFALAAAFYPNFFLSSKNGDEDMLRRELAGRNHLTTLQVSNLPQYVGFFYHKDIVEMFRRCLTNPRKQRLQVYYEQSKAYVEFVDSERREDDFTDCLYLAIRMRMLQRETMRPIFKFNDAELQHERERLIGEVREVYRQRNRLVPTLILITDEMVPAARPQQAAASSILFNEQPTAALISAVTKNQYAMPAETQQVAKIEITHVISGCTFFARFIPVDDGVAKSEINILRRTLNIDPLKQAEIANLDCSKLYVSFHKEFAYQRVKILNFLYEEGKATVFFVDIGEETDVDVSLLYECPEEVAELKYRAVRCKLAKVRDSTQMHCVQQAREKLLRNQFERNDLGERRLKQFDAEIFSVVEATVHIFLRAKNPQTEESFVINKYFVERQLAEPFEETAESRSDHESRNRMFGLQTEIVDRLISSEQDSYWPIPYGKIQLPNTRPRESFHLRIAKQPSELTFCCPVYGYGETAQIRIGPDSVNGIVLDQFPQRQSPCLLTAASVAKDDRSGSLLLSDTTLYPPTPGYPAIVAAVCAPAVELIKGNRQHSHPIGVFCGLGPELNSEKGMFSDHDMYLTLDTEITEYDLGLINSIRSSVNDMINRSNPVITQNAVQFRKMQQNMIEAVLNLMLAKREYVEPEYPALKYLPWCLKETTHQQSKNVLKEISAKMHGGHKSNVAVAFNLGNEKQSSRGGVSLYSGMLLGFDDDENGAAVELTAADEIERNLEQLKKLTLGEPIEFESVTCLLCNIKIETLRQLRVHVVTRMHRSKEELLRSRQRAEPACVPPRPRSSQPPPPPPPAVQRPTSSMTAPTAIGRGRPAVTPAQQAYFQPQQQHHSNNEHFDWTC